MFFRDLFQRIQLGSHKNTIPLFVISLGGSLLPLLLSLLFIAYHNQWAGWAPFYTNGEFYLYSAGFLTSASYLFYSYKQKNYDIFSWLFVISLALTFIDSILYAFILSDKTPPNHSFLKYTSFSFFGFSVFVYYISSYMNTKRVDLLEKEIEGIQKIKNQLP